ncbi:hypothetical protein OHT57_04215 [Streptomyces sp. NBC_00285]|uniref:hypothetical protein n=1 Tax=Streptomyces sp. NBC_00285 TaxID=2975700 RepID=UPI002E28E2FC|nr:hypothetical protein [Streptomyces sp. NBC_00285]
MSADFSRTLRVSAWTRRVVAPHGGQLAASARIAFGRRMRLLDEVPVDLGVSGPRSSCDSGLSADE